MHRMLRYKMCCQATKPCMGSWTCNLLKLAQALSGTPPGRAAVYGAGPLAGRLGWLSRPGRAPTKWDVAHSLDARPHLSTLHHCGPIVQSRGGAAPRIQYQSSNSVNFTIQGWVGLGNENSGFAASTRPAMRFDAVTNPTCILSSHFAWALRNLLILPQALIQNGFHFRAMLGCPGLGRKLGWRGQG